MGLFDFINNMGGSDITPQERRRAQSIALLQAGAGMLANNTRNYGNAAPAIGAGLQNGLLSLGFNLDKAQTAAEKRKQLEAQKAVIAASMMQGQEGTPDIPATPAQFKVGDKSFHSSQAAEQYILSQGSDPQALGAAMYGEMGGTKPLPDGTDYTQYLQPPYMPLALDPKMQVDVVPGKPAVQGTPGQPGGFNPNAFLMAALQKPEAGYTDVALKALLTQQGGVDPTAQMKNYKFLQSLPPDERQAFQSMMGSQGQEPNAVRTYKFLRDLPQKEQALMLESMRAPTVMNLGGTQAVRAPLTGGISESYPVTPKPEQMPAFQAAQETAKTTAKGTAEATVKAGVDLPKVEASANTARKMVNDLLNHPGLESSVGMTMRPGFKFIPGTKEADFNNRLGQLQGAAFLQAFNTLKGGGQITEVEGAKATAAINRMNTSTSEAEFKAAAQDFLDVIDTAESNAKSAAGDNKQYKRGEFRVTAPNGKTYKFNTQEDADRFKHQLEQ